MTSNDFNLSNDVIIAITAKYDFLKKIENIIYLLRNDKTEDANRLMRSDYKIKDFFIKYKIIINDENSVFLPNNTVLDQIIAEIDREKFYLQQQKNTIAQERNISLQNKFIKTQHEDLIEAKEDRKRTVMFTYVVAFGVIISTFTYFFESLYKLFRAVSFYDMSISAIATLLFLMILFILISNLDMKKELSIAMKKYGIPLIILILFILVFVVGMLGLNDWKVSEPPIKVDIMNPIVLKTLEKDTIAISNTSENTSETHESNSGNLIVILNNYTIIENESNLNFTLNKSE